MSERSERTEVHSDSKMEEDLKAIGGDQKKYQDMEEQRLLTNKKSTVQAQSTLSQLQSFQHFGDPYETRARYKLYSHRLIIGPELRCKDQTVPDLQTLDELDLRMDQDQTGILYERIKELEENNSKLMFELQQARQRLEEERNEKAAYCQQAEALKKELEMLREQKRMDNSLEQQENETSSDQPTQTTDGNAAEEESVTLRARRERCATYILHPPPEDVMALMLPRSLFYGAEEKSDSQSPAVPDGSAASAKQPASAADTDVEKIPYTNVMVTISTVSVTAASHSLQLSIPLTDPNKAADDLHHDAKEPQVGPSSVVHGNVEAGTQIPSSVDVRKVTQIGKDRYPETPKPIFSKTWQGLSVISDSGGTVQLPGSDVLLKVPPGAIGKRKEVGIFSGVSTDTYRAWQLLKLPDNETVSSPLVEYWAEKGFRFKKNVQICLPHFMPSDPNPKLVRVYRVVGSRGGQLTVTRLRLTEATTPCTSQERPVLTAKGRTQKPNKATSFVGQETKPEDAANATKSDIPFERTGVFWLSAEGQIVISTNHFCGYVCTYCDLHQGAPILKVIACGSHKQDHDGKRSAHVTLHLWDNRLDISDFQKEIAIKDSDKIGERSLPLRDYPFELRQSTIHARLDTVGWERDCWQHCQRSNGCPAFSLVQNCKLNDFLSCDNVECPAVTRKKTCPVTFDWMLESKPASQPGQSFRCVIDICHTPAGEIPPWDEGIKKSVPVEVPMDQTEATFVNINEADLKAGAGHLHNTPPFPQPLSAASSFTATPLKADGMFGEGRRRELRVHGSGYEQLQRGMETVDVTSVTPSRQQTSSTESTSPLEGASGGNRGPGLMASADPQTAAFGETPAADENTGLKNLRPSGVLPSAVFGQYTPLPNTSSRNSDSSPPSAAGSGSGHFVQQQYYYQPVHNFHINKVQGEAQFASNSYHTHTTEDQTGVCNPLQQVQAQFAQLQATRRLDGSPGAVALPDNSYSQNGQHLGPVETSI